LKEHKLYERKSDYRSVAVIGCQSSGKSTLLNLLFDTSFETMDNARGRQQTTKGIWMSKSGDSKVLIFDIEGTDSKERGE
jgi:GTPase Era involved in 16S rRNA processing